MSEHVNVCAATGATTGGGGGNTRKGSRRNAKKKKREEKEEVNKEKARMIAPIFGRDFATLIASDVGSRCPQLL